MTSLLKKLSVLALGAVLLFSGHAQAAIQGAADYRSSLTAGISAAATTLTAVATSTPSGENLTVGAVYGLKLGGREYVLGTLSAGKQFTSLIRGVSLITGTTTGGIAEPWGRGTAVEITDAPVLLEIINKVSGRQVFDNPLKTSVSAATIGLDGTNLATVQYANNLSFGAVAAASETAAGFSELATQAEAAAGTSSGGTGARLVLPGSIATSTYNSATAANRVLVTGVAGKLDQAFIPTTISDVHTYNSGVQTFATTSINTGAFPAWQIGKQAQYFTSAGTTTFSVPSGITKVQVEVQAGGGAGGGGTGSGVGGGSGAGGGYSFENVDVTGTTTVQVFVGSGGTSSSATAGTAGTWSTFGTNGFYLSASGGLGGSAGVATGAIAGTGSGGDINIAGTGGSMPFAIGTTGASGPGGSSRLGGGAPGNYSGTGGTNTTGGSGGNYGGGGAGGSAGSTGGASVGGAGAQGLVIVSW